MPDSDTMLISQVEDTEALLRKYRIIVDTHKKELIYEEDHTKAVFCEEIWSIILDCWSEPYLEYLDSLEPIYRRLKVEDREKHLQFAISLLLCFIQANFTGPQLPKDVQEYLKNGRFTDKKFASNLMVNGEEININTKYPVLLVVSQAIFLHCSVDDLVNAWWSCRARMIHQAIIDQPSGTIRDDARLDIKILTTKSSERYSKDVNIEAQLTMELVQIYHKVRDCSSGKPYLERCRELLGLRHSQTGVLGKRTKHQEHDLAQLRLDVVVTSDESGLKRPPIECVQEPKDVKLNDDVLLDEVRYVGDPPKPVLLSNLEQQYLLGVVQQDLLTRPRESLQIEQLLPYLEVILAQKSTYCVRFMALLIRSKLQSKDKRAMERAMKQMEVLQGSHRKSRPPAMNRMGDVFATGMPPMWQVDMEYGNCLLNFELIKEALEAFTRAKAYEQMIACYVKLERKEKATAIVRKQLEANPTPKMMCFLGDLTDDVSCYEKAWEMSEGRSARAQRHWGDHFYEKKNYTECLPHYGLSLSMNPMQPSIWFRYGYAAMQEEDWQIAATAFKRYTVLEPDSFEAWNNLAQAHLKKGSVHQAHHALTDALRCDFDNWRVWENFLLVSCDCDKYTDVVRAYHRLIDLRQGKYLQVEALTKLANYFHGDEELRSSRMRSDGALYKDVCELFGRVASLHPTSGVLWSLYASLAQDPATQTERLQKSYRCCTFSDWYKDKDNCCHVLDVCERMARSVLHEKIPAKHPSVNAVRINLVSAVSAVRKQNWEQAEVAMDVVSELLKRICDKIKAGQN